MRIINFKGGLGNQIFQFQFYLYIKSIHKGNCYGYYNKKWLKAHNGLELDKVLNIELPKATLWSNTVALFCRTFKRFTPNLFSMEAENLSAIYQDGYWQKACYYSSMLGITYRTFSLSEQNRHVKHLMHNSKSVSIHVRRGDYLKEVDMFGGICTLEYYKRAIAHIYEHVDNPYFFVLSDDILWAKNNFSLANAVFIDWNIGKNSYLDMYMMSQCRYHIIANSSYSYWGAALSSQGDGYTICPKKWNRETLSDEIALPHWIQI